MEGATFFLTGILWNLFTAGWSLEGWSFHLWGLLANPSASGRPWEEAIIGPNFFVPGCVRKLLQRLSSRSETPSGHSSAADHEELNDCRYVPRYVSTPFREIVVIQSFDKTPSFDILLKIIPFGSLSNSFRAFQIPYIIFGQINNLI